MSKPYKEEEGERKKRKRNRGVDESEEEGETGREELTNLEFKRYVERWKPHIKFKRR